MTERKSFIFHPSSRRRETHSGGRGGHEDQASEVGGALVAKRPGGVDQGADAVALQGGADEGSAPCDGGGRGLLGADELLAGVGDLGALIGLAEEGGEDCAGPSVAGRSHGFRLQRKLTRELSGLVEDGAEGDGRGLHRGEVWRRQLAPVGRFAPPIEAAAQQLSWRLGCSQFSVRENPARGHWAYSEETF